MSRGWESNPRPLDQESDASATEPRCSTLLIEELIGRLIHDEVINKLIDMLRALTYVCGLGKVRIKCIPQAIATWHDRNSNPRPQDHEPDALTTLPPRPIFSKLMMTLENSNTLKGWAVATDQTYASAVRRITHARIPKNTPGTI
ncbi:hypothetical protein ElyMa_006944200 [Elysia marginata]|uniref:Uncharacterized protein n=1 Tax=Elysia marginata TaxID=1093978 RepID=A0AAV4JIG2_9GAST|nr:hypothetical protein ElyMa_006944200 [Elysia marginata]